MMATEECQKKQGRLEKLKHATTIDVLINEREMQLVKLGTELSKFDKLCTESLTVSEHQKKADLEYEFDEISEEFEKLLMQKKQQVEEDKARNDAENAAEKERNETENAAEKARNEAENAAEKARNEAENAAEKARNETENAAEKARNEAENAAEKARNEAENAAEKARNEAEKARNEADKANIQGERQQLQLLKEQKQQMEEDYARERQQLQQQLETSRSVLKLSSEAYFKSQLDRKEKDLERSYEENYQEHLQCAQVSTALHKAQMEIMDCKQEQRRALIELEEALETLEAKNQLLLDNQMMGTGLVNLIRWSEQRQQQCADLKQNVERKEQQCAEKEQQCVDLTNEIVELESRRKEYFQDMITYNTLIGDDEILRKRLKHRIFEAEKEIAKLTRQKADITKVNKILQREIDEAREDARQKEQLIQICR